MKETAGVYSILKQALGKDEGDFIPLSLTTRDAARVLGVPVPTVRRMISDKKLRCVAGCKKPLMVTTESIVSQAEGVLAQAS